MAKTVGIFGPSGWGKTTSIVVGPDGKYDPNNYQGLDPASTIIIESDKKDLPFPGKNWVLGRNVFQESTVEGVKELLATCSATPSIKVVCVDTINAIMLDREMEERKKKSYDKWMDLAADIYELIVYCNSQLRPDLVVFLMGHTAVVGDDDNTSLRKLITNGRKMDKIQLESKLSIVLMAVTDTGVAGETNGYKFETQAVKSTGKSPIGMFDTLHIPNSLSLVTTKIREYYGLPA